MFGVLVAVGRPLGLACSVTPLQRSHSLEVQRLMQVRWRCSRDGCRMEGQIVSLIAECCWWPVKVCSLIVSEQRRQRPAPILSGMLQTRRGVVAIY